MISINICGEDSVYLPDPSCDDCDALIARVEALEEILADLSLIDIAKMDINGDTVTVNVLGKVV